MVLEEEFWRSWDQNEELGQAACASSVPATWTMGACWTCMIYVHCPRCSLNLAGPVPPGHRLLCRRKESGSTGSTILCQCPKKVVAIFSTGVRRRKPMLRLRPTRWSRSCRRTSHWRALVRMSSPKNWTRAAGSRIATSRCSSSLPGEGLASAKGVGGSLQRESLRPRMVLLPALFSLLAEVGHPPAGSWVRAGMMLRNSLGWSRVKRERWRPRAAAVRPD